MIVQDDGLTNAVNTFCDSANERLGELSKKLFANYEEVEKWSSVYEALGKVPGIDLNDQILLSDRLVKNPKKMDLFFSLPEDARARMIRLMLDEPTTCSIGNCALIGPSSFSPSESASSLDMATGSLGPCSGRPDENMAKSSFQSGSPTKRLCYRNSVAGEGVPELPELVVPELPGPEDFVEGRP
ncbi:hypothetical protein Salat_1066100 [Sesamum alatum]|uniref:Uncharacterized protein n=1 Tax=Sesamum alatum TaxID=300844 RepID=A0AAE2CT07_9LAMI|nr:hypothetical protein Salat_1066100 [Sesamum alatum]